MPKTAKNFNICSLNKILDKQAFISVSKYQASTKDENKNKMDKINITYYSKKYS